MLTFVSTAKLILANPPAFKPISRCDIHNTFNNLRANFVLPLYQFELYTASDTKFN